MKTRILDFQADLKAVGEGTGEFEGYGSVFGVVDSYRDVVDKGAFVESLKTRGMPAFLWQHDARQPIGIFTYCDEDDYGLKVRGKFNLETQMGREAHSLLKMGALTGLSIGFDTEEEYTDPNTKVNHLKKVNLWEVSLVTFPANSAANVESVKAKPETITDFEKFLREAGFSRSDATLIASKGFKALKAHSECGDLGVALAGVESAIQQLKKVTQNVRDGEAYTA